MKVAGPFPSNDYEMEIYQRGIQEGEVGEFARIMAKLEALITDKELRDRLVDYLRVPCEDDKDDENT
jgi:hypothetical protein